MINGRHLVADRQPVSFNIAAYTCAMKEDDGVLQCENIARYCALQRMHVIQYYNDIGSGGVRLGAASQLSRLLHDARAGKFHAVVCSDTDWLSRDLSVLCTIYERLTQLGIELHDVLNGKLTLAKVVVESVMSAYRRKQMMRAVTIARGAAALKGH